MSDATIIKLIPTSCPICSGQNIEVNRIVIEDEEKQKLRKELNEDSSIVYLYKGAKWTFEKSIGSLVSAYGLPYPLGNEMAKLITRQLDYRINTINRRTKKILDQIPDLLLIEIRCADCGFVINRYSTD